MQEARIEPGNARHPAGLADRNQGLREGGF